MRKIITLLLIVFMLLTLASCGTNSASNEDNSASTEETSTPKVSEEKVPLVPTKAIVYGESDGYVLFDVYVTV